MVGAEGEKILILEPLDRRKRPFQSICKEKNTQSAKKYLTNINTRFIFCVFTYFTYTFMFNPYFFWVAERHFSPRILKIGGGRGSVTVI